MPLTYHDWNKHITKYFFKEDNAGKDVILFVNKEIIDEIGKPYGGGFDDFVQCLVRGPDFVNNNPENICKMAYETYNRGKQMDMEYPSYIAYLALFVCAATIDGDYDRNAYYPKLKDLVGDDQDINMSALFSDYISDLWKGLQRWSQVKTGEAYGRFTITRRGGHVNVGIIYAQTILSENERKNLPTIFSRAGLDPTDPPTEDILKSKLRRYGEEFFENRTKKLLNSNWNQENTLLGALIDLVLSELERWDGTVPESGQALEEGQDTLAAVTQRGHRWVNVYARVCLSRVLGGFSSHIRFKVNPDNVVFPEDGLEFKVSENPYLTEKRLLDEVFSSHQTNKAGWSRPLQTSKDGRVEILKAELFDWSEGATFVDGEMDWKVVLRPADVRVFLPGGRDNLPDTYVEAQHLEHACPFLIACRDSFKERITCWGESETEKFEQVSSSGIPEGWSLFQGENAKTDCRGFDPLTLPKEIRLKLVGGVRHSAGSNKFLHFAPPTIVVEGSSGNVTVMINGEEIPQKLVEGMQWDIPSGYNIGESLTIDVLSDSKKACNSRTIQFVGSELIEDFSNVPLLDSKGRLLRYGEGGQPLRFAQGVVVYGVDVSEFGNVPLGAPTYLSNSITFLGPEPGMVACWPNDPLPTEWSPVWALAKTGRNSRDVHYCGLPEDDNSRPRDTRTKTGHKTLKLWKESVWVNRKRNNPPKIPKLRKKWSKYMEVAKHV
ncbi:hypothetical protein J2129_001572 [Methanofollis sp. W23]|uniref:hypothetical protein n=1 Tax=Methanofollis sp. W23 TaxID=2817849 RepID=UPI001AEAEC92|nr:hypothetical protein [Methanofollis sp. W23]MBP2146118.1 hypothetical protein [Methanofollis sp. W23]